MVERKEEMLLLVLSFLPINGLSVFGNENPDN